MALDHVGGKWYTSAISFRRGTPVRTIPRRDSAMIKKIALAAMFGIAACSTAFAAGFRLVKDIPYYPEDVLAKGDDVMRRKCRLDIRIPEGEHWSIEDGEELKALVDDFKSRLYNKQKE